MFFKKVVKKILFLNNLFYIALHVANDELDLPYMTNQYHQREYEQSMNLNLKKSKNYNNRCNTNTNVRLNVIDVFKLENVCLFEIENECLLFSFDFDSGYIDSSYGETAT